MKIPEGARITISDGKVSVSGSKGTLAADFSKHGVKIQMKGDEVEVSGPAEVVRTVETQIMNMAKGVTEGYVKKVKIVFSHFPISVEVKGKEILIKNFLGEKQPRKAAIKGEVKIEVKGQEMTLSSISKEDLGQTFANIKNATKIRKRDSRVFQDGFYAVEE